MAAKTISSPKGAGNIRHNNREFLTDNVDAEKVHSNRVYVHEDIHDAYASLFGEAVTEYNNRVREKHPEQVIDDYLDKISRDQSGKKPFYETIFQIGDMKDTNIRDEAAAAPAIAALDEFARTFQERNPNLHVFNMTLHLDEQTPHLHIDYIPVARKLKRGMSTQNALAQALRQQGFTITGATKKNNETMAWQAHERAHLTEIAEKHGIEITVLGEKRDNFPLRQFKEILAEGTRQAAEIISEAESEAYVITEAAEQEAAKITQEAATAAENARQEAARIAQEAARIAQDAAKTRQNQLIAQKEIEASTTKKNAIESEIRALQHEKNILSAPQVKKIDSKLTLSSLIGLGTYVKVKKTDFTAMQNTAHYVDTVNAIAAKKIKSAEARATTAEARTIAAENDRPSIMAKLKLHQLEESLASVQRENNELRSRFDRLTTWFDKHFPDVLKRAIQEIFPKQQRQQTSQGRDSGPEI
jgi:hypothetical protein